MANNILETTFVFNDRDYIKIDAIHKKLTDTNDYFNNLGKNSSIGNNIADSIKPAENALDSLNKKAETLFQKPTISRYWETEEQKTVGSLQAIENAAIKTNISLSEIGKSNAEDFSKSAKRNADLVDLDNLCESRVEK